MRKDSFHLKTNKLSAFKLLQTLLSIFILHAVLTAGSCGKGSDCKSGQCSVTHDGSDKCIAHAAVNPNISCQICQDGNFVTNSSSCYIDKTCYANGSVNGSVGFCQTCNASLNSSGWSIKTDTCRINGSCYNESEFTNNSACDTCQSDNNNSAFTHTKGCNVSDAGGYKCIKLQHSTSTTNKCQDNCQKDNGSLTTVKGCQTLDGSRCVLDGSPDSSTLFCKICQSEKESTGKFITDSDTCFIDDSVCYNNHSVDPSHPCLACDASANSSDLTIMAGYCLIDSECHNDNSAKSGTPCEVCDSSTTTSAWTNQSVILNNPSTNIGCLTNASSCVTTNCSDNENTAQCLYQYESSSSECVYPNDYNSSNKPTACYFPGKGPDNSGDNFCLTCDQMTHKMMDRNNIYNTYEFNRSGDSKVTGCRMDNSEGACVQKYTCPQDRTKACTAKSWQPENVTCFYQWPTDAPWPEEFNCSDAITCTHPTCAKKTCQLAVNSSMTTCKIDGSPQAYTHDDRNYLSYIPLYKPDNLQLPCNHAGQSCRAQGVYPLSYYVFSCDLVDTVGKPPTCSSNVQYTKYAYQNPSCTNDSATGVRRCWDIGCDGSSSVNKCSLTPYNPGKVDRLCDMAFASECEAFICNSSGVCSATKNLTSIATNFYLPNTSASSSPRSMSTIRIPKGYSPETWMLSASEDPFKAGCIPLNTSDPLNIDIQPDVFNGWPTNSSTTIPIPIDLYYATTSDSSMACSAYPIKFPNASWHKIPRTEDNGQTKFNFNYSQLMLPETIFMCAFHTDPNPNGNWSDYINGSYNTADTSSKPCCTNHDCLPTGAPEGAEITSSWRCDVPPTYEYTHCTEGSKPHHCVQTCNTNPALYAKDAIAANPKSAGVPYGSYCDGTDVQWGPDTWIYNFSNK